VEVVKKKKAAVKNMDIFFIFCSYAC